MLSEIRAIVNKEVLAYYNEIYPPDMDERIAEYVKMEIKETKKAKRQARVESFKKPFKKVFSFIKKINEILYYDINNLI